MLILLCLGHIVVVPLYFTLSTLYGPYCRGTLIFYTVCFVWAILSWCPYILHCFVWVILSWCPYILNCLLCLGHIVVVPLYFTLSTLFRPYCRGILIIYTVCFVWIILSWCPYILHCLLCLGHIVVVS